MYSDEETGDEDVKIKIMSNQEKEDLNYIENLAVIKKKRQKKEIRKWKLKNYSSPEKREDIIRAAYN